MLQTRQESTRKLRRKQESLDDQLHLRTMDTRPKPFKDQTKEKDSAIVDNCPAHPHFQNLTSVTLLFLPPNTTSKIQPMNQGIIMNFNQNYRRLLISKLIDSHDNNSTMTASVYTAILLIHKAWRLVTQVCIQNCYRRGGFQQTAETVSHNDYNDIPLLHLQNNWCQLTTTTNTPEKVDFETYASIDDELIVADRPTEDDIVASIIKYHKKTTTTTTIPRLPAKKI